MGPVRSLRSLLRQGKRQGTTIACTGGVSFLDAAWEARAASHWACCGMQSKVFYLSKQVTYKIAYERVRAHNPGFLPDKVAEELHSERGKEKKQRLLAYLREHPEELRPAAP